MKRLRGVGIGAGYFSKYQYEAWSRMQEVERVALCNRKVEKARQLMEEYGISLHYTDYREMIRQEKPDFVDVITPPYTHLEMCKFAAEHGVNVLCQKPLAPTIEECREIVRICKDNNVRFMVNENWRWQPWYREIKRLINAGEIGQLFSMTFIMRMGDGWGADAYLNRQPYFRQMPRLLIYETGVHFIDTFRFLAGEVESVYARTRKLNPVIAGEDCGHVLFNFESGAVGVWDASRYNEKECRNPRYTFGTFLVEGSKGSIEMDTEANMKIKPLGEPSRVHDYPHEDKNFCGDSCYFAQRHFVDCLLSGEPFETNGDEYLKTWEVQEACYKSARLGQVVRIGYNNTGFAKEK
jgi:predicted dehydrogenase